MKVDTVGHDVQAMFEKSGIKHQACGPIDEHGAVFNFQIGEPPMRGFVSCEDNAEDLGYPTVTLAIFAGELASRSKEDLLQILNRSGSFYGACLSAQTMPDGVPHLLLQRRIKLESWRSEEFMQHVTDLLGQSRTISMSPDRGTEVVPETSKELLRTHLAFLGYTAGKEDEDGWIVATHPIRWGFHLKNFGHCVILTANVRLAQSLGSRRPEALECVNRLNETSTITRFSLFEDASGGVGLRLKAVFPPYFDRAAFGISMDLWHQDCESTQDMPSFEDDTASGAVS